MDRDVRRAFDTGRSARVIVRYRSGAKSVLSLTAADLKKTADDAKVAAISSDARIAAHGSLETTLPFDDQHLRRTLGLDALPHGGGNVGVAVIDSGIAPVPDLVARITAFYDFTNGGVPAFPSDSYGHGTHVAGLIAGNGLLSAGKYPGIAPDVRLIGLKVLDGNGAGYTSDLINAIDFAVANRTALGIDVINLSLGHPVLESASTDPLVQAVERASAAGIVVIASAGNRGRHPVTGAIVFGGISAPGNAPSAITIGAERTFATETRGDDTIASYSSRGPTWYDGLSKPDILAPGDALIAASNPLSKLYEKPALRSGTWSYLQLSGTSMSTAVASGVVALMIDAHRSTHPNVVPMSPNTVKALLQYSALPVTPSITNVPAALEQGTGALNAAGAIALARSIDTTVATGQNWLSSGVTPVTAIAADNLAWAANVIWGDRHVWGESIAFHESAWSAHWGDAITWGSEILVDAFSFVTDSIQSWSSMAIGGSNSVLINGTHVVWGDAFDDDDHVVWGNLDDDHVVWGDSLQ